LLLTLWNHTPDCIKTRKKEQEKEKRRGGGGNERETIKAAVVD